MRSRNIKPAFFKNEHLANVSPHARLLFIGLWCMADVKGRMEYRPARIRVELFPYESVDMETLLNELASSPERFIIRYETNGSHYLEIPNFSKHQNPHKKEKDSGSSIPAPRDGFQKRPGNSGTRPGNSGSGTVPDPIQHRTSPADSLLLIPDSLSPETGKNSDSQKAHLPQDGVSVGNEIEKFAQEGFQYLLSLNHPNFSSPNWVTGYLKIQLQELAKTKPDLPKQEIIRIWRDICDVAVNGNVTSPNWFKKVFPDKLEAFGRLKH